MAHLQGHVNLLDVSLPSTVAGGVNDSRDSDACEGWLRVAGLSSRELGTTVFTTFASAGALAAHVCEAQHAAYVRFPDALCAEMAQEKYQNSECVGWSLAVVSPSAVPPPPSAVPPGERLRSAASAPLPDTARIARIIGSLPTADAAAGALVTALPAPRGVIETLARGTAALPPECALRLPLRIAVTKALLRVVVNGATPVDLRADAAVLLAELFVFRVLDGDGFSVLSKVLSSPSVSNDAAGVAAVVAGAEALSRHHHGSETSEALWLSIGGMARTHLDTRVRAVAVDATARHTHRTAPEDSHGTVLDSADSVAAVQRGSAALRRWSETVRRRTVHLSRLSPHTTQGRLMAFLSTFGDVARVRVCATEGFPTLFAFVEMATPEAAQGIVMQSARLIDAGVQPVKCNPAKAHVQDASELDAVFAPQGDTILVPCSFGAEHPEAPLSQAVHSAPL